MSRKPFASIDKKPMGRPTLKEGERMTRVTINVTESDRLLALKFGSVSSFYRAAGEYFLLTPEYKKGVRGHADLGGE